MILRQKNDKIKKLKYGGTVAMESLISILCVYLKTSFFVVVFISVAIVEEQV